MTSGLRPATLALVLLAAPASAQVVRGTVTDTRTQAPIPGVVVSLEDATAGARSGQREVLTNERGEYAVQAGAPGRYLLTAKRVGLKRFVSPPFDLAAGAGKRVDITLEPIDFTASLPVISVVTDAPCTLRPSEATRVAALWDEARAALTASRLALRDRLFTATMVRYTRELTPVALRVVREEQSTQRGATERPFFALEPVELSRLGYMHPDANGGHIFYAPDAAVLTSGEFLRDHCFALAPPSRERRALVGLSFEPVEGRSIPDIRGSFWMDSATHELRLVEFRYVNVGRAVPKGDPRGEVRFAMTPNGTWYVSRWFIRMPQLGPAPSSGLAGAAPPLEVVRYKEDGGDVTPDGLRATARGATLTGRAMDSTGRHPLSGATVRLAGTPWKATTRTDGYFRLDSLPAGGFSLVLEHPDYDALGLLAAEQDLDIEESSQSVTALQALDTERILRRLCSTDELGQDRGAVRIVVAHPQVAFVRVRYDTFEKPNTANTSIRIVPHTEESTLDDRNAAAFCDLPAQQPIRVELLAPDKTIVARDELRLQAGAMHARRIAPSPR